MRCNRLPFIVPKATFCKTTEIALPHSPSLPGLNTFHHHEVFLVPQYLFNGHRLVVVVKIHAPGRSELAARHRQAVVAVRRFYAGKTVIGIIQLVTLGGCGIWTLVDFIMLLCGSYKDGEGKTISNR